MKTARPTPAGETFGAYLSCIRRHSPRRGHQTLRRGMGYEEAVRLYACYYRQTPPDLLLALFCDQDGERLNLLKSTVWFAQRNKPLPPRS